MIFFHLFPKRSYHLNTDCPAIFVAHRGQARGPLPLRNSLFARDSSRKAEFSLVSGNGQLFQLNESTNHQFNNTSCPHFRDLHTEIQTENTADNASEKIERGIEHFPVPQQ